MRKFHALFIGVDAYSAVKSLNGCVNDALSIYEYISKTVDRNKFEFHPTFLLSIHDDKKEETRQRFEKDGKQLSQIQLPTQKNILQVLLSYTQKVQAGDVFLFFYAGHGSTERAHPYFEESTGKLQTLVPCDARMMDPEDNSKRIRDVLDKEIRYRIRKIWEAGDEQVEIIMIQDSCHSSEASRDLLEKKEENLNVQLDQFETIPQARQAEFDNEFNAKYRSLEDMSSFDEDIRADMAAALENKTPIPFDIKSPEAPHIHMSACGKLQFAFETNYAPNKKGGVFTHTLIKFLEQTGGQISYNDLFNRAKASIDGIFDQTPSIYVKGDSAKRYERFLGGMLEKKEGEFNVSYQTIDGQTTWSVDAGALLGLPVLRENEAIPVQLYDLNAPNDIIDAQIDYIKAEASTITFTNQMPDVHKIYKARIAINYFIATPLKLIINPIATYHNPLKEMVGDVFKNAGISFSDNETAADYKILARAGFYELYKSGAATPTAISSAIRLNKELVKKYFPNLGEDLSKIKVGKAMGVIKSSDGNYTLLDNQGKTDSLSEAELLSIQYPYAIEALQCIAEQLKGQNAKVFVVQEVTYNNPFKSYFALPEAEYYWNFMEEVAAGSPDADYILSIENGQYVLSSAKTKMPVVKASDNLSKVSAFQTLAYLRQMNRWTEAKDLTNPHPDAAKMISAHLFEMEINNVQYAIGSLKEYPYYFWTKIIERDASGKIVKHEPVSPENICAINFVNDNGIKALLNLTLHQRPKQGNENSNLYVGVLALGYDYEIASLFDAGAQDWVPYSSDGLTTEGDIRLEKAFALPALAKSGKAKTFEVFLKIMVAYKRFDPSEWLQEGLPQPEEKTKAAKESGANRAVLSMKKGDRAGDWIAFNFPIQLTVPEGLNLENTPPATNTIITGRGGRGGPWK